MGIWRERLGSEEVIAEATNGLALLIPRFDDNFGEKRTCDFVGSQECDAK